MHRLLTYICLLMTAACLSAAETVIVGTVRDAKTGEPIENANVWYKNTGIGCATNSEGLFLVRTDLDKKRTLLISAVGYKQQKYPILPGQYAGIEVELEEESTALTDVFITPGENPALALMQRVRDSRKQNDDISRLSASYTQNQTEELFISDIRQKHLQRLLWRSLKSGMLTDDDSTCLLPLYVSRSLCKISGGNPTPLAQPLQQSIILTETDYSFLLQGLPQHFNFYKNNLTIFGSSFISPLAASGNSHYLYYLADSIMSDTTASARKSYLLHFRSKNPYEPSFNGEMLIDSATCALLSISATVPREVSLNYLTSLQIRQTYDSLLLPQTEDLSMIFDFAIKADTSHVFPTVLLKRNQQTLQILSTAYLTPSDTIPQPDTTILSIDSTTQASLRKLEDSGIIRLAKLIAYIINTGNIPTGEKLDIGNAVELVGINPEEGFRLGIPLTTNEKLWKNVELSGYIAYGFGDRALKGKGQIRALLPTPRRNLIGAYYWDHYAPSDFSAADYTMRENSVFYGEMDFAYMFFGGITYNKINIIPRNRRREFRIWTENDLTDNVETLFSFQTGRMGYGSPLVGYHNIPSFRYNTISATVRLGFGERKVDQFMLRKYVHSQYPAVHFIAQAGSWRLDESQTKIAKYSDESNLYARLSLVVQQTIPLGIMGTLDYSLQTGIIFGEVPYPLLEHFIGNQSYTYDPYRFTLLNSHQYAADRYIFTHMHWNMQGALFNRIPYIQRLHLRELLEFKFAYGALSQKHNGVLALPDNMGSMTKPYVEAGVGIGNILRVADIYAIFRLTDLQNTTTPWWAIRARFSLGL